MKKKKNKHPYKVGEKYFIKTVTLYYTGRLIKLYKGELVMSDVAWIANTGRLNEALTTGKFKEVEPLMGNVIINRDAIIDISKWPHALHKEVVR